MTDQGDESLQPPSESIRPSVAKEDGAGEASSGSEGDEKGVDPMVAVYRHDVHKARMRSHEDAAEMFRGLSVNQDVPLGADGDAAVLSRPRGSPEQTVDNHESWLRVSLLTGNSGEPIEPVGDIGLALYDVISIEDPEELHAAWLDAAVPALFSESPYYPYTSLKYHTLLTAALLDNYRAGAAFDDLFLAVSRGDDADVIPHRTVLSLPGFDLHVTSDPDGRPAARLGDVPTRSFAEVWARLQELPFDVNRERRWRVLDAQLRRIRSWSVALQYIEEYVAALGPAASDGTGGATGGESRGA
ncbi:hypothetical protein RH858_16225 [Halalkaliarchaeum sp. AArc-GB]|uniref:hypothetical protein n=2 Tax=Halobacteriales TaxID=2235 RepID=UPI0028554082|nr:hypothetical protein [Halalkaliarchaeum sp. AArc-GB]MDR5674672.1 hypothetical protein [Halalkaliarchaeum sp. AArc-GB]